MRDFKLYLCAAFVLILAALRFLFPDQAAWVQAWAVQAADPRSRCLEIAQTLGRELEDATLRDGLVAVFQRTGEALS